MRFLFLISCALLYVRARELDYKNATPEQVAKLTGSDCFFLDEKGVALMPPVAFSGFQPSCVERIVNAFAKINAEQLSYLTGVAFGAIEWIAFISIPIDAFRGVKLEHARNFPACGSMKAQHLENIVTEAWGGFQASCVNSWGKDACRAITPAKLKQLTCDAFGGFKDNIQYVSEEAMAVVSDCQLKRLSTGTFGGACGALTAIQISAIPAEIFARGMRLDCLGKMEKNIEGLTIEQFELLSSDQLSSFTGRQTSYFNVETICPFLDANRLSSLQNSGIRCLLDRCVQRTPDNILEKLSRSKLRSFGSNVGGFTVKHWQRMSPERVGWLYGTHIMFLSHEVCSAMTLGQLSSICRIAFNGLRSECTSGLSAELALHIKTERGSLFDPHAIKGFTPQFFRNLRPEIMARWNATQVSSLQPGVCAEIRPEQFKQFPAESFSGFNAECVAMWNPVLMDLVTLDHLRNLQYGWTGFNALQFHTLVSRFGNEFWLLVEETETNKYWTSSGKEDFLRSWRQADCFKSLFSSGLLNYTEGGFVQNWIIMASRADSLHYPDSSHVAGVTMLSGLHSIKLNMLNTSQIRHLSPSQFEKVSTDEINVLERLQMWSMEGLQIRRIRPEEIANITLDALDGQNGIFSGEFSCAQVDAVPEDKWTRMRFGNRFFKKLTWCERPVNDSIAYDGENGQRYSEQKLGHFYEENCNVNLSTWERQKQLISAKEIQFSKDYKPLEISETHGCVCNYRLCYRVNDLSGCFEETPQKCNKNDEPPPDTMDRPSEPPSIPPSTPPSKETPVQNPQKGVHVSIEPGSVVGIVFALLLIGALGGGFFVYKKYPEKLERIKRFRPFGRSEETSPLLAN